MTITTTIAQRERIAKTIRADVLRMTASAKSGHVGSNFSMAEILATLYGGILHVDATQPGLPARDRLVVSKGHACAGVYSVLSQRGFFPREWLDTFYKDNGKLWGHVSHPGVPGVEASTGALGHGLPMATGMALAGQRDEPAFRAFCILSDGECDEGSNWEAALFAGHHKLDNLTVIVDYNKIQSFGTTAEVANLDPLADKWRSFGWAVREVDGHDLDALDAALRALPFEPGRPSCIVAHTVKGKGVSFMENTLLWHYRTAVGDELAAAYRELGVEP